MKTDGNNEQMLFADSLGSCPGSGHGLCGRHTASYTCAAQRDANPTDRYIGAANCNIVSNRCANTTYDDAGACGASRVRTEHHLHVQ